MMPGFIGWIAVNGDTSHNCAAKQVPAVLDALSAGTRVNSRRGAHHIRLEPLTGIVEGNSIFDFLTIGCGAAMLNYSARDDKK
jgi:hypothetical protein